MNEGNISRVIEVIGKYLSADEMESFAELIKELMVAKANQLAEWTFPLAEILEQYNQKILARQCSLNYSEVALIIQNSVNVFERRVDRLYLDASGLRNSLNEHDAENEAAKASKPRQRSQRKIDLDNINRVDFLKDTTKNPFLKRKQYPKKVKLLSQRYPQLENMCRRKFSLDILDTQGEKIGKKYDFRCTQQCAYSQMLVDELSPEDLVTPAADRILHDHDESLSGRSRSSTVCSAAAEPMSDFEDDFRDSQDAQPLEPMDESGYGTMTDVSDPRSQSLTLNTTQALQQSAAMPLSEPKILPAPPEQLQTLPEPPGEAETAPSSPPDTAIDDDPMASPCTGSSTDSGRVQTPPEELLTPPEEQPVTEQNALERKRIRESIATDRGYNSEDPEDAQPPPALRRSKRQKKSLSSEVNITSFEPIPFEAPIPEKIPKGRAEFKLPCNIALLKSKRRERKRKVTTDVVKRQRLTKFLISEEQKKDKLTAGEEPMKNKLLMYSPSRTLFSVSSQESKAFQKIFEERFKNRLGLTVCQFDAVLTDSDDLRGFAPRLVTPGKCLMDAEVQRTEENKEVPLRVEVPQVTEDRLSSTATEVTGSRLDPPELPEASCSYTPPHSPDFSEGCEADIDTIGDEATELCETPPSEVQGDRASSRTEACEPSTSSLSHQRRIEMRMRELQKEFDVRNDREEETARWYVAMKALRAAERRPEFNVSHYERRIVKNLREAEDHRLGFQALAAKEEPEDIARLFVASLHLANTYTVGITVTEDKSNVSLSLLNSGRFRPS